ncbi:MAG TPA: hypothetical protein PK372_09035 [Rugosibacter sp.]|nr:hypothetical protein [Rugosibacter sp.]HPB90950.1 hypothetical protein [Rugosibacter sp.]HQN46608.1 hypothetical protein [Rugosibacter sp.]HQQ36052.1 hypothetical protein [Rugosibacter sp.]
MSTQQDALIEVVDLIKRHDLRIEAIAAALDNEGALQTEKSASILSRLFGYIGGIFVFAGIVIYVSMQWDELNAVSRIILTLGTGFSAFIMALVCMSDERFEKAATPLFLVAVVLESAGILVTLKEFSRGGDPAYGLLFLHAVMAIQQSCAFYARQRTVLALTTTYFVVGFFSIAFDLLEVNRHLIGIAIGLSLLCVGWRMGGSRHKSAAGLVYFFGSILFLGASYDWLRGMHIDIVFPALAGGMIFLSTVARSRTLLFVATLALIGYIGKFMAQHFAHNLAGPVGLMLAGFLLIGIGALAVRINKKYITEKK